MTTMNAAAPVIRRSRRQRVGLALAALLSIGNVPSVLTPTPDGEVGPPILVLWLGTVLGVVGLVAVVIAWRSGNRAALRVAAGALIVTALTALPALFVDINATLKLLAAVSVVLTVIAIVLMFSPDQRTVSVDD
jgi:hypothetical protein